MMIDRAMTAAAVALLLGAATPVGARTPTPAKPIGDPASWISADDYPASAIRAYQQGVVRIMLDIAADGQFACHVVMSSEVPALDNATCALLTARARFEPARDERGRPITTHWTRTIRWQLPWTSSVDLSSIHMMSCPGGDRDEIQVETAYGCYR